MPHRSVASSLALALFATACGSHANLPGGYTNQLVCLPGEMAGDLKLTDSGDPPTPGRPSDIAAKAEALLAAKDWANAVPLLQRVARGEGQDDRGNIELANYQLGVAYYHLHHGDLSFDQMKPIALDVGHLKHREALVWMANLSLVLPQMQGQPMPADYVYLYSDEDLRLYDVPEYRDLGYLLYYLRGRGAYRRTKYIEAMQIMTLVERYGPYRPLTTACNDLSSERLHSGEPPK